MYTYISRTFHKLTVFYLALSPLHCTFGLDSIHKHTLFLTSLRFLFTPDTSTVFGVISTIVRHTRHAWFRTQQCLFRIQVRFVLYRRCVPFTRRLRPTNKLHATSPYTSTRLCMKVGQCHLVTTVIRACP